MKIRQHNRCPSLDSSQTSDQGLLKPSKIVTRQAANKAKQAGMKENVEPHNGGHMNGKANKVKKALDIPLKVLQPEKKQPRQPSRPKSQPDLSTLPYHQEILSHIATKQNLYKIPSRFLKNSQKINQEQRAAFVRHFLKIGQKFNLRRITIYMAVNYMDAYLYRNGGIGKGDFMMGGLACMWIAMKYEEIYPPDLQQWTKPNKGLIQAQASVLQSLQFNLNCTTLQHYLSHNLQTLQIPQHYHKEIKILADTTLFDDSTYLYSPSELSLAIIYSVADRAKLGAEMEMGLRWMMERNGKNEEWVRGLRDGKYGF